MLLNLKLLEKIVIQLNITKLCQMLVNRIFSKRTQFLILSIYFWNIFLNSYNLFIIFRVSKFMNWNNTRK